FISGLLALALRDCTVNFFWVDGENTELGIVVLTLSGVFRKCLSRRSNKLDVDTHISCANVFDRETHCCLFKALRPLSHLIAHPEANLVILFGPARPGAGGQQQGSSTRKRNAAHHPLWESVRESQSRFPSFHFGRFSSNLDS